MCDPPRRVRQNENLSYHETFWLCTLQRHDHDSGVIDSMDNFRPAHVKWYAVCVIEDYCCDSVL